VIAISSRSEKYVALVNEYRIALARWSEARALHSSGTSAVVEAESDLEDVEGDIRWLYGNSAFPIPQSDVSASNVNCYYVVIATCTDGTV
jgi:hypothetical protein